MHEDRLQRVDDVIGRLVTQLNELDVKRVVVDNDDIMFSVEFEQVGDDFLPWQLWQLR